jgi:hypothetical protein
MTTLATFSQTMTLLADQYRKVLLLTALIFAAMC